MRSCFGWISVAAVVVAVTGISAVAAAKDVTIVVSDPDGAAARVGAPVEVEIDQATAKTLGATSGRVELLEMNVAAGKAGNPVWAQWGRWWFAAPVDPGGRVAVLRFLMPPGPGSKRTFLLKVSAERPSPVMNVMKTTRPTSRGWSLIVNDDRTSVLHYQFGTVAAPPGVDPKYARSDYIHPLHGPSGEVLTDDFPKDHPHHRGVWWSWPVTRWKNEVRDIWAVAGVWSREHELAADFDQGPVFAGIAAGNLWKWGDRDPIVAEMVAIRAFRQAGLGRFVDIDIRLTGLEDEVAIGGRPHGGYGGFAYRAAPTKEQKIVRHTDPPGAKPRRSWLDYSGIFAGDKEVAGVAIFEHPSNPLYPSTLQEYASINCVMPAFPGEREVPIPKGKSLTLKHRLWIHPGRADEKTLADVWSTYANPPKATVVKD